MATNNPIAPGAGDVVLKHEASSAGSNYSVRQVPGATQVLCNSREGALTFATVFAERHHLIIWEERDGAYAQLTPAKPESGRS